MNADDLLTQERRARMAAERLLAQKEAELFEANRMLSRHARTLSEDLVETRGEVEVVKGENTRVRADLERATTEVTIAKRRLWSSIETIEDGFAVFDSDHRLIVANPAYFQPFDGLECIRLGAHYEEVVEAVLAEGIVNIGDVSPAQWRENMLARWYGAAPEPYQITLWDGTHVRLVDRRAPGGDTVCLGLNVTEAIQREEKLEHAMHRAEAANRAKSAFLANMSHEIRTPMNGVVSMADLMAEADLDDELSLYVDTIRTSGRALLTIINDVLDYSKIEASKLVLHAEPFDLEKTILEILLLLQPTVREKGLKVILDYDMFLPTRFEGDPVRVRQVLTNLIGNAVKFTETGHVLVRVVGLPIDHSTSQRLHITVEDTGIGISPEMQPHVFGEFNQVEDERNRSYEGTGLGLSITKELIDLMHGKIWVESALGEGSCFGLQLNLPVVEKVEELDLPLWMQRAVLVMPDDLHRDILAKRLVALGLAVRCVETGEEGVLAARKAQIVFIDTSLGDMTADAFIAAMPEAGAHAHAIALGHVDGMTNRPKGAAGMLHKPLARPELLTLLADLRAPEDCAIAAPAPVPDDFATEDTTPTEAAEPAPVFGSRRQSPTAAEPDKNPSQIGIAPEAPSGAEIATSPAGLVLETDAEMPIAQSAHDQNDEGDTEDEAGNIFAAPKSELELRTMRVLAAEDNKTNRLVLSKLVKACDIELTFAENGFEAVEAFKTMSPDLIFMDISMPGMDGKEATRTIRDIEAAEGLERTRIVALTAHAMTGDGEEIMGHGLDKHLTKPLKKALILAEIENACPKDARAPLPQDDPAQVSA